MRLAYIRKANKVWLVDIFDAQGFKRNTQVFMFQEGAFRFWNYYYEFKIRQYKAKQLLTLINISYLTVKEFTFWKSMRDKDCEFISKRQYGYLKGLQERNPR